MSVFLDMKTNEVLGDPEKENLLSRWFYAWEVDLYEGYKIDKSYDGMLRISI